MFKDKIRKCDIEAIIKFSLAWPIASILRHKHRNLWLVSERRSEARDNGYWMFKYIKENCPEQEAYYVIAKDAKDRSKIEEYGNIVSFGSFRHYIIFLLASKHISAHINSDSPNSRVSNFLETHGLLKNKRIFLQHGITKDKISFGYYSVSRADLFVCAAKPEYEFCKKEFGYPEGAVQLLGFARFDNLGNETPKRQILMMPTWRAWLANVGADEFVQSNYFRKYQSILNNLELGRSLEENDIQLVFYPHSDMQKFVPLFEVNSFNITIADGNHYDVQQLLNESMMLITDYSSVAFDMAYMRRPVVYYHFDYDEYRAGQHPEGYFSYVENGFGEVLHTESEVVESIKQEMQSEMRVSKKYQERIDNFFTIRDKENCKRIFDAISNCRRL